MDKKCPVCIRPTHTDKFDRIHTTILDELNKRNIQGVEDPDELAKALAILVADSLETDIYT